MCATQEVPKCDLRTSNLLQFVTYKLTDTDPKDIFKPLKVWGKKVKVLIVEFNKVDVFHVDSTTQEIPLVNVEIAAEWASESND